MNISNFSNLERYFIFPDNSNNRAFITIPKLKKILENLPFDFDLNKYPEDRQLRKDIKDVVFSYEFGVPYILFDLGQNVNAEIRNALLLEETLLIPKGLEHNTIERYSEILSPQTVPDQIHVNYIDGSKKKPELRQARFGFWPKSGYNSRMLRFS